MSLSPHLHQLLNRWIDLFMYRSMLDLLAFFRENNLSMSQYSVYMSLYKHGPAAVSDLALLLNVSRAAASQMVDRLVEQDLVVRIADQQDRRVTHIALTDAGRTLTERCIAARTAWMADLAPLSSDDADMIEAGLEALVRAVEALMQSSMESNT